MNALAITNPFTNPKRRRKRRRNPFKVNPMTKKQKTGLTVALAAAAGLAAFFLFGKKAKAEPGVVDPGKVEPPVEPPVIPDPKPAEPKGELVDVTWGAADQLASSNIPMDAVWAWHRRPKIVEGVDFGQSVKSRDEIASAAFVKTFAASPTVKSWPGRRIPAKSDVAPGQHADWEKFVNAWKQARTRVGKLHNDSRTSIFVSQPGCLVVEIGAEFYNVNHAFIATGVLQGKPAGDIAEELWAIAEDQLDAPCSGTFAVNTAKKVMAQKFIDEFGAKP